MTAALQTLINDSGLTAQEEKLRDDSNRSDEFLARRLRERASKALQCRRPELAKPVIVPSFEI